MKPIYWITWRFVRILLQVVFGLKGINEPRVPREGAVIVAANHQSYLDPPALSVSIKREMHFFAKKELFDMFFLGRLIRNYNTIPVRRGVYDPQAMRLVTEALKKGAALIMFPEGTRGDGKTFLSPKPGIGMIAKSWPLMIVPAYIQGTDNLVRTFWRRRMKVFFGEPISSEEIEQVEDNKEGYRSLAETIMDRIAQLKSQANGG